jgi:hypothetical protein
MPPLQPIGHDYSGGSAKSALDWLRKQPTQDIVDSLKPGAREPLTTYENGKMCDGNTRIKVLEERGFDVNKLPRVIRRLPPVGPFGVPMLLCPLCSFLAPDDDLST